MEGGWYWDKPGKQIPSQGMQAPYDPENDPGFNHFDVKNGFITLKPSEVVQQRILIAPGANKVSGLYSTFDAKTNQWSFPAPFVDVITNPYNIHVMHLYKLSAVNGQPTRYAKIEAFCPRAEVTVQKFLGRLEEEIRFILDLHLTTSTLVQPGKKSIFTKVGRHQHGKYTDYKDLGSFKSLYHTKAVPGPHADIFLRAVRNGFSDYEAQGRKFALGVLAALSEHNGYVVPYRYRFGNRIWVPPEEGQQMVFHVLLSYLCDCAEYYKDNEFFVAAYLVAEQMLKRSWWTLHPDPEGLFYVSCIYQLDAEGELNGRFISRSPLSLHGASVHGENEDHLLLRGAAALSKFLRVFQENAETTASLGLDGTVIHDAYQAVQYSLFSFYVYSKNFNTAWIDNFYNQAPLTAAWWSNYDRRDDYAGYNFGLGMAPIFRDQCRLVGYESMQSQYWVQPMFNHIGQFAHMWAENARRGGIEAADTHRFYHTFCILNEVEACRGWTEQFLPTYVDGLNQMVKGFIHDGSPPVIGTWEIWDFAPYKSSFAKEVTVPGVLFSWAADVYVVSRENLDEGVWLRTVMDAVLNTIQETARGEAGYEADLSIPEDKEGGGEFRLATGLFDMQAALKEYGD